MRGRRDIDGLDGRDPRRVESVVRWVERLAVPYHRATVGGLEHVPAGPVLFAGNHSGGAYPIDMLLFGAALYRARGLDALPYGLAHEVVLRFPWWNEILCPLGAVRAGHDNAERLFARGRSVLVYPGGDVDAMRPFRDRHRVVFGGRTGYVRLALRAGVPIVPVVSCGSHSTFVVIDDLRWLARAIHADRFLRVKVWPLTLCLPFGVTLGPLIPYFPWPARIRIAVLPPICFARTGPAAAGDEAWVRACADRVESTMQRALTRLAAGDDAEDPAAPSTGRGLLRVVAPAMVRN